MARTDFRRESLSSGFAIATVFNILSRILSLGQGMATAFVAGVSTSADVYFYSIGTAAMVASFLRAVSTAVFLPRFSVAIETGGQQAANRLLSSVLVVILSPVAIAVCVAFSLTPLSWHSLSGLPVGSLRAGSTLLLAGAVLALGSTANFLISDFLAACSIFRAVALVSFISTACPLVALGVGRGRWGLMSLAIGAAVGSMVSSATLLGIAWRQLDWRPWQVAWPLPTGMWTDGVLSQAGSIAGLVAGYLPLVMLGGYGEGAVSAVGYSRTVAAVPRLFLLDHATSFAALKFNAAIARKDWGATGKAFSDATALLGFFLCPACAAVVLLRTDIVAVLFAHRSGPSTDLPLLAALIAIQVGVVPVTVIDALVGRLLQGLRHFRAILAIQIASNLLILVSMWVLLPKLGPASFAYSMAVGYGVTVLLVFPWLLGRVAPDLNYGRALGSFLVASVCSSLVLALVFAVFSSLVAQSAWPRLAAGACGFVVTSFAGCMVAARLGFKERIRDLLVAFTVYRRAPAMCDYVLGVSRGSQAAAKRVV